MTAGPCFVFWIKPGRDSVNSWCVENKGVPMNLGLALSSEADSSCVKCRTGDFTAHSLAMTLCTYIYKGLEGHPPWKNVFISIWDLIDLNPVSSDLCVLASSFTPFPGVRFLSFSCPFSLDLTHNENKNYQTALIPTDKGLTGDEGSILCYSWYLYNATTSIMQLNMWRTYTH